MESINDLNDNIGSRPIVHGQDVFMPKTYKKLYDQLCSLENLHLAYKKTKKGKNSKWYVIEFEADLQNNLLKLK